MIRDHYRALKQRIAGEVTALKIVDWFMSQYDRGQGESWIWTTPAAFVEFMPLNWVTLGGNVQRAELAFDVHLVNSAAFEDDKKVVDITAVDHFAIADAVFRALMNFRANVSYIPEYSALEGTANDRVLLESIVRTGMTTVHDLSDLLVSVQSFKCVVYDYSAVKTWVDVVASLTVTAVITPPETWQDEDGQNWQDEDGQNWETDPQ